jgi:short-subunit dehydrogenase
MGMKSVFLFFGLLAIPLAIFLQGDADIGLLFASNPPDQSYSNQIIWVTGASSGLGAAAALELARLGAKVIISARRVEKLYSISNASQGVHEMFVLPLDMIDLDSHQSAYEAIITKYGRLDILILNAGQSQRNSALDTPFEDTRSLMELNFFSCVHLTKVAVPGMVASGGGKVSFSYPYSCHESPYLFQVVLMSSLSGKLGTPIGSSYSASKFALVSQPLDCFPDLICSS